VSTPDPALVDTDVASVLYRVRLFRRVVPAGLVDAGGPTTCDQRDHAWGSELWALRRKWSAQRTAEMLNRRHFEPLTLHSLRLL